MKFRSLPHRTAVFLQMVLVMSAITWMNLRDALAATKTDTNCKEITPVTNGRRSVKQRCLKLGHLHMILPHALQLTCCSFVVRRKFCLPLESKNNKKSMLHYFLLDCSSYIKCQICFQTNLHISQECQKYIVLFITVVLWSMCM